MFNLNIKILKISGLFILSLTSSTLTYADDIEGSIKEALQYYRKGEYKASVESLNYASQLIQQKIAEELESFLPEPLSGWTAQKASSQAMGTSMFGGGIMAERHYSRNSSSITVQIITDSPFTQIMMMMFTNPMFVTFDGGKLEKIDHQKAIIKFNSDDKRGEIKIVVANRFLVSIEGKGITEKELKDYANAIDYKKLQSLP